ncbi:Phenylalanine aminomutase (L-beta-phenylalanine forming) [Penicillium nucicola]|uniref:Phenylalanine aminomutase (L-beta-phenylalanine forming) n=1 Tax=Penicillium nucicola TaxID=1850975 RepID=UPI0025455D05|nr:Phenylalanine aminomutase (L-beta-phenylalanine forming) [Penicillium nucicola]KAJ5766031.1 Phenylalanine aminomutase (L-beta-phenylalanine forming) [Penicillium nucicola]
MMRHLEKVHQAFSLLENAKETDAISLSGDRKSLELAHLVAVARSSVTVSLSTTSAIEKRVQESIDTLNAHLNNGEDIYGVNTGCGGNANSRTGKVELLQKGFLQHHQSGILPGLPNGYNKAYALPEDVTRGAILLRCNSLIRGHSAVGMDKIQLLIQAMNKGITPIIPLRGSISASGDLGPLSYVGGLLEGNPGIFVQVKPKKSENHVTVMSAADALRQASLSPVTMRAKEALGLINGTAPSAAAAALVLHDAHILALLAQLLTAMTTEALLGSVDNYHDFISQCRPHPGQIEVADNIRSFLIGSHLSIEMNIKQQGLVQDRYALRTAPQWIGPVLEDLMLADDQVTTELNSSTDNPLIDVAGDRFHHGGNFQAASVTTAMEKTKTAIVMLGRLIASQCQELVNPAINKGLPPNLCFDDPSLSFTCKGTDVNMSAYLSELAYLGNSVVSHVQVAEMNNQSVNSLALVTARYTAESVDILTMMCAVHLYSLCQALDLRALDEDFFDTTKSRLAVLHREIWYSCHGAMVFTDLWTEITEAWHTYNESEVETRCKQVARDSAHAIFDHFTRGDIDPSSYALIPKWTTAVTLTLIEDHQRTRKQFLAQQSTPKYLAPATREIYQWIRHVLQVPLHRGLVDHPGSLGGNLDDDGRQKETIGTNVTKIYMAIRDGQVTTPLFKVIQKLY